MQFDRDPAKAASDLLKHRVSLEEAKTVFNHPRTAYEPDPEHSLHEERFRATGESASGRLLVVTFTDDGDITRLISAREATRREKRRYAERR